jgi:hypothetical protein
LFQHVEAVLGELRTKGLHRRIYSDVIDSNGHQYVDLLMEVANMPMASFVDGIDHDDADASDFIDTLLKRPGPACGLWNSYQVIDNRGEMMGLNRIERFHSWLKIEVLDASGISDTRALRARMARTPEGWHLLADSPHRISRLEGDRFPSSSSRSRSHRAFWMMSTGSFGARWQCSGDATWKAPSSHPSAYLLTAACFPTSKSMYSTPPGKFLRARPSACPTKKIE